MVAAKLANMKQGGDRGKSAEMHLSTIKKMSPDPEHPRSRLRTKAKRREVSIGHETRAPTILMPESDGRRALRSPPVRLPGAAITYRPVGAGAWATTTVHGGGKRRRGCVTSTSEAYLIHTFTIGHAVIQAAIAARMLAMPATTVQHRIVWNRLRSVAVASASCSCSQVSASRA
jgi:hypothetical protein